MRTVQYARMVNISSIFIMINLECSVAKNIKNCKLSTRTWSSMGKKMNELKNSAKILRDNKL